MADRPDLQGWTASMSGSERLGLHGRTLTQALLGEPVQVDEIDGSWARVRLPWQPHDPGGSGYPGWVRLDHLGPDGGEEDLATEVAVAVPTSPCAPEDGEPVTLSYGTVLGLLDTDREHALVSLPDARTATLPLSAVRLRADPAGAGELLDSARQFIGLRYLWGGTSGWGLDCSGLVHLVHRVHGHTVPRDASDQHEQSDPDTDGHAAAPGGLYFFARPGQRAYHVGFVTPPAPSPPSMLHAPESGPGDGGLVEEGPVARERLATLVGSGTFLPRTRDSAGSLR